MWGITPFVGVLLVAACSGNAVQPAPSTQSSPVRTAWPQPPVISEELRTEFATSPQTVQPVPIKFGTNLNLHEPIIALNRGWLVYLQQFAGKHPGLNGVEKRWAEAVEPGPELALSSICLPGTYPAKLDKPVYCRAAPVRPVVPQTGLVLLPPNFTADMQAGSAARPQDAWWAPGILAAMLYLPHLSAEAQAAGIDWPRGELFDWCLAGIGLRTMFNGSLPEESVKWAMGLAYIVLGGPQPPVSTADQFDMIKLGFATGWVEMCMYTPHGAHTSSKP